MATSLTADDQALRVLRTPPAISRQSEFMTAGQAAAVIEGPRRGVAVGASMADSTSGGAAGPSFRGLTQDLSEVAPPGGASPASVVRAIVSVSLAPKYDQITKARAALAQRAVSQQLSRGERSRLQYLEWQIDQIEDAMGGAHLDLLEALARKHEDIAKQVGDLMSKLTEQSPTTLQRRPSRRRGR